MSAPAAGPLSLRLLRAIEARLNRITTANDYNLDVDVVAIGKVSFAEGESPAIALWIEEEQPESGTSGGKAVYSTTHSVIVEGHVTYDGNTDNGIALELLKADMKRALFEAYSGDAAQARGVATDYHETTNTDFEIHFAGSRMSPRDDTSVTDSVQIVVTCKTSERTGNPYSQT